MSWHCVVLPIQPANLHTEQEKKEESREDDEEEGADADAAADATRGGSLYEDDDPRVAAPHIIAAYLLRLPVQPHARHQGVGL